MRFFILLLIIVSLTACNLIPHQYKTSDELVTNFVDAKTFQFEGAFKDVFPILVSSAEFCGLAFRQRDIDIGGVAAASNYEIRVTNETGDSARLEIWSIHFIDTYLYEVIDVSSADGVTIATHYQLKDVHDGNKFRLEDMSSWYGKEVVSCE
jgi:hypothetical protein